MRHRSSDKDIDIPETGFPIFRYSPFKPESRAGALLFLIYGILYRKRNLSDLFSLYFLRSCFAQKHIICIVVFIADNDAEFGRTRSGYIVM